MTERRRIGAEIIPFPAACPAGPAADVGDLRFRALIGEQAWAHLPEAIRARFGKRISGSAAVVYVGEVVECRIGAIGWLLAQLGRLIGGPLPLSRDADMPACVSVTEDPAFAGQFWTRIYGRRRGFPQVISSSKRFAGPTGLEEYVGYGVSMALVISVEHEALLFRSAGYSLQIGGLRLSLPAWLTPGDLTVIHSDLGGGAFRFTLDIVHPRFGRLIRQSAVFREAAS